MKFDLNDQRHLLASEGWLELGLPLEAEKELEKVTLSLRGHPLVLEMRWHILAKQKKWEACVEVATVVVKLAPEMSDGWIHRSFALHELQRTQEAYDQLVPVVDKFPKVWTITYNLACYSSRLHQFDKAQQWLKQALAVDKKTVQEAAEEDDDLKPLRKSLGGFPWERE